MVQITWHNSGTYNVKTKIRGSFGAMRYVAEISQGSNNGLDISVRLLKQFLIISYVDLYQLVGVVKFEVTEGPNISFHPGREEKTETPEEGLLPDTTKGPDHLMDVFWSHRHG